MGYSTTDINVLKAMKNIYNTDYEMFEASDKNYFGRNSWKQYATTCEISDHNPPRYYFKLNNGGFVAFENKNKGGN